MAFRRKRRSRGNWFPVLPTIFSEGGDAVTFDILSLQARSGTNPIGGLLDQASVALVPDFTEEPSELTGSLRDIVEGQDWTCDRAVGKVWGGPNNDATGAFKDFILAVGLAVLPVDDDPVSQGSPALPEPDWDPLLANNSMAPWLWRRTWRLLNGAATPDFFGTYAGVGTIEWYGSVMDGGHIDTKGTKRRIMKEQRLFLVASARSLVATTDATLNTCFVGYDLRIHGGMRKAMNRSTFK